MSNRRSLHMRHVSGLFLCCTLLVAAEQAIAQDALPGVNETLPGVSDTPASDPAVVDPALGETQSRDTDVGKRGRITPFNGAILPESEVPDLQPPLEAGKLQDKEVVPSGGVGVLDRMGVALPELPKEKPFEGKADDAYGAYQRGYYLTAMELALPRAQLGDAAAQTLVAEILSQGLGVPQNAKDAAFWYEQAANAGDPNAMFKYALILIEGRYVKRDRKLSEEFMKKAADLGNSSAQFNYAQVLVADTPGERGLKAAMPYYEKSAEQGIADAQYAVSQIYMNVEGIDDGKRARAREWLARAARAGYDTAQLDLAIWLIDGIGGDRNLERGFEWMKIAAEGGNVVAQNKLSHLYVNAIGTGPDPVTAAKWYVLSRRAGLKDPALEDFYLGLTDEQQKNAVNAANKFRAS